MSEISLEDENEDTNYEYDDDIDVSQSQRINIIKKNENVASFFNNESSNNISSKPKLSNYVGNSDSSLKPNLKQVPLDDIGLLMNTRKKNSAPQTPTSVRNNDYNRDSGHDNVSIYSDQPSEYVNNSNNYSDNESIGGNSYNSGHNSYVEPEKTYAQVLQEKQEYLYKLGRLEKSGFKTSKKYTLANDINDIKSEYDRVKRERDVQKSINFSRKMLMACVSGIEFLNGKFDPLDVKLDGWSESVNENLTDYDEVFEELHDKYNTKIKIAPELRLLMMVGGSAFMFHLTNSFFKSSMPGMGDILKQNPDIMNNLRKAAMSTMQNSNNGNDPVMNMMMGGMNMQNQRYERNNNQYNREEGREMRGPSGVDDILNQLNQNNSRFETMSVASDSDNVPKSSSKRKKKSRRHKRQMDLDL